MTDAGRRVNPKSTRQKLQTYSSTRSRQWCYFFSNSPLPATGSLLYQVAVSTGARPRLRAPCPSVTSEEHLKGQSITSQGRVPPSTCTSMKDQAASQPQTAQPTCWYYYNGRHWSPSITKKGLQCPASTLPDFRANTNST